MKTSTALGLSIESFGDFGQVLSKTSSSPAAQNAEYDYWGKVTKMSFGEKASSGILLCHKRDLIVKRFERHERTPEVLVALDGDSLLCLAKATSQPTDIQWFRIHQGDAIALHSGTWHWIPFPLGSEECRFLVIFAFGTEDLDLHYSDLVDPITFVS